MYVNPYGNSAPYELRKHVENLKKKIAEEAQKPDADIDRINKIQEALYIPNLFGNTYRGYERFRNPW